MLNYNKMDEVLINLETQADNLKSLSETQTHFENALDKLSQNLNEIQIEREQVEQLVKSVEGLENTHKAIDDKIETVLQDYKKLHSSFEYIELELKKNTSAVNEIQSDLNKEINGLYTSFTKMQGELNNAINSLSTSLTDIHSELQKDLQEINSISSENNNKLSIIQNELESSKRSNKNLAIGIFVGVGISIVTLVLSVIGMFI